MSGDLWAKTRYLDASALVKLVVNEDDGEPIRLLFQSRPSFCATSLCVVEALGVLKAKWSHGRITEEEYHAAAGRLVIDAWGKRIEVDDIGLFNPEALTAVQALAKKHSLDISDALQLETILRGKYSHLGPNSASVLITADGVLAAAARAEGIRVWNCIKEPTPLWA